MPRYGPIHGFSRWNEIKSSYETIGTTGTITLFVGLQQSVECLKSISLALALCECEIDVPRAVYLSRLEQVYQIETWGSVEWFHDLDIQESQARIAAATLFTHLLHDFSVVQTKQKSTTSFT